MFRTSLLCLTLLLICSCGKEEFSEELIRPVQTLTIIEQKDSDPEVFSGYSRPDEEINLAFQVAGEIDLFPIKVGDRLKRGDLIGRIRQDDFLLKIAEAEAALDRAKADARNAVANYKRIRALYETDSASRNELDAARAASESTAALVSKNESQLSLAQRNLGYTILTAPQDCIITREDADPGEYVGVGKIVATLGCGGPMKVVISVPAAHISKIELGQQPQILFNDLPDRYYPGLVTEVGVKSVEKTTFDVKIILEEQSRAIRAGMAVRAFFDFVSPTAEKAIYVPTHAVAYDSGGHYVYLFLPFKENATEGTVQKTYVKVGRTLDDAGLQVIDGLEPGDVVVTAGIRYLQEGKKVKILGQ